MTEKRFTYENHKVKDNLTGEIHSSNMVSVNVLNELNDTNNQLREEIKDFQDLLASKEEVYLKPVIRQIEEAYNNERTQIGRNVLKQLLEAIE